MPALVCSMRYKSPAALRDAGPKSGGQAILVTAWCIRCTSFKARRADVWEGLTTSFVRHAVPTRKSVILVLLVILFHPTPHRELHRLGQPVSPRARGGAPYVVGADSQ